MSNSTRSRRTSAALRRSLPRLERLEDRTTPATLVWTGDVDANWGTSVAGNTNWNTHTLPANGDSLTFPTGAAHRTNVNNLTNLSVSIIVGGADYVIAGNAITLTGLSDTSFASGANVLNFPITLSGTPAVSVSAATSRLTLSGVISGAGTLTKTGSGILRLGASASNTYTGLTTVSAGTLELNKSGGALAVPGNVIIDGGAVNELAGDQIANTATVRVNSGATFTSLAESIGSLVVAGGSVTTGPNITLTAGFTTMTGGSIAPGSTSIFSTTGVTTNAASSLATISGNLSLNNHSEPFTVADGPATPDLDISAVILNGGVEKLGAGTLRVSGSSDNPSTDVTSVLGGVMELDKAGGAEAVSGDLNINGGTVRELIGDQIVNTSTVTLNPVATFDLNGFSDAIGALTDSGGSVTIGAGTLTAGPVSMTGGSISSGGGKLVLQGDVGTNTSSAQATISGHLDLGGVVRAFLVLDGTADLDLEISAVLSNGGVEKQGTGTLRLDGGTSNTDTGITKVDAGLLELGKIFGALSVPGTLVINGGVARELASNQIADTSAINVSGAFDLNNFSDTIHALVVVGSVTIGTGTLTAGPLTMNGGSITSTLVGTLALQGDVTINPALTTATISGNLNFGGSTPTFTVADGFPAVDLDISALIFGAGSAGLLKDGPGLMSLDGSASNAYPGVTQVVAGSLEMSKSSGALAVPGIVIINGGIAREVAFDNQIADTSAVTVTPSGTLDLNGFSDSVGTLNVTGGTLTTGGTSAGRLTAGNTLLTPAATLLMKMVDAANSDRITVNGTLATGGALQLSLAPPVAIGTTITLIDNDGSDPVSGTFANLPQGASFFVGGQLFAISYTGGTGNDVVVTRTGGPTVLSAQVNDGSAQRSRVTSVAVTFSAQVNFAGTVASAFTLARIGGGAVTFAASASVVNGVTVVTLNNFTGSETEFGSLKDGRYALTAQASQITFGGQQLDGNGDGTPGDNFAFDDAQGLFRMFGDVNGDQSVNGLDLGFFRNAFGTSAGDPNYLSYLDFNGDGVINGFDLGQFRTRFGTMLP